VWIIAAIVVALIVVGVVVLGGGGGGDSAQSRVTIGSTRAGGATSTRPSATTAGNVQTISTSIRGSDPFLDTGARLKVGDVVTVTATGTITHAPGNDSSVGPAGDSRPELAQFNVIPGNHAALLGRFGTDGQPFVIGASKELKVDAAAVKTGSDVALFVGINDVGLANNGGAFTVTLAIRRA
jgi:hypothetical protein